MDITNEDNIYNVQAHIDIIIQYADSQEPKDGVYDDAENKMESEANVHEMKDFHI